VSCICPSFDPLCLLCPPLFFSSSTGIELLLGLETDLRFLLTDLRLLSLLYKSVSPDMEMVLELGWYFTPDNVLSVAGTCLNTFALILFGFFAPKLCVLELPLLLVLLCDRSSLWLKFENDLLGA